MSCLRRGSPFGVYESLFHVLKRNGYQNVLLCPLGGVDVRIVDWGQIDRCFQSDLDITFDSMGYRGPFVNYFGEVRLFSPLDQYSLSYAYDRALRERPGPFSLFFCTLNSHYPWHAVGEVVADWRSLDNPSAPLHACAGDRRSVTAPVFVISSTTCCASYSSALPTIRCSWCSVTTNRR